MLTSDQRAYLRDLAKQVAELADSPKQKELRERFCKINRLQVCRPPVVMIVPETAQKELFVQEKNLVIREEPFAGVEKELLCRIGQAKIIKDDTPVTKILYTGAFAHTTTWLEGQKTVRANEDGTSSSFVPVLNQLEDIQKMHKPELVIDRQKAEETYQKIADVLGDILDVRKNEPYAPRL